MTTNLSPLLDRGVILPFAEASGRKDALATLSAAMAETLSLPADLVEGAVMEREKLGSTGVGEGVAIPHARMEGLETPVGGFMKLAQGVDFDAIDERPCDLILMLIAPINDGASHLRALAQVSRAFRHDNIRAALRSAESEADIRAIICA